MKNLLPLLTCFIIGLYANTSYGQQTYAFEYDDAGNRTSRTIVLPPGLKSTQKADSAQSKEYKETMGELEIVMYPNPTEGILTVELKNLNEAQPSSIMVYDYSGRLLQSKNNLGAVNTIDLSQLPRATYILRISSGERKTEWTVVKQ
jgi:hypothetical protein